MEAGWEVHRRERELNVLVVGIFGHHFHHLKKSSREASINYPGE